MEERGVVVIGGGVNGFAAAGVLARAGLDVVLVDRDEQAGGSLRPVAFSDAAWSSLGPLGATRLTGRLMHELDLARHGLVLAPYGGVALAGTDGSTLCLTRDPHQTDFLLRRISKAQASRFRRLRSEIGRVATLSAPFFDQQPLDPQSLTQRDGAPGKDLLGALARFDDDALADLLELSSQSCADRLEADLGAGDLSTLIAAAALSGQNQGPMTPGSALSLAFVPWLAGQGQTDGPLDFGGVPVGGAKALSQALVRSAEAVGVDLRLGQPVRKIRIEDGAAAGVVLANGQEIRATTVVSSLDIKRTMTSLVDWTALAEPVHKRIARLDTDGAVARFVAVVTTLDFLPDDVRALRPQAVYAADSLTAMEQSSDLAASGLIPASLWLDLSIPGLTDPETPPDGPFVVTASVHHVPAHPSGGPWTDSARIDLGGVVLDRLEQIWPGFNSAVCHVGLWLPAELETTLGRTGGHLTGGDLAPDRLFWNRPVPDMNGYAASVKGLYLCGPDTHNQPGAAGHGGINAAYDVIARLDQRPARQAAG